MVTVDCNSFTNPFKSDKKKHLIHVSPHVYMFMKLILEISIASEDEFALPLIANNLLSMT